MATYFSSDFADSSTDWTERYNTTPDWAGGVSGGDLTIPSGSANDWSAFTWNDVDGDSGRADVDVLLLFTTASSITTSQRCIIVRGSGADESATHFHFSIGSGNHSVGYCDASDTRTNLATRSVTYNASTDYWVRFRITGTGGTTTYKTKVWTGAAGDEPGGAGADSNWDLNSTTTSGTSSAGWVGISTFGATGGNVIKQIGVGTNGDTAPSSAGGGATIAGDSLTHAHSLSSPSLTQSNVLAVQGVAQSHSLGAPALTQHNVLAVNAIAQAHALGNVTLTQAHILTVQGIGQAHSLGAPSLTQHNALTPAPLTQAQTLGNVTLTIAGSIAAANIAQGHSIGTPALTQHHVLTVAALMQAQSLGQPALAQAGTLAVDGMTQAQVLDALALVQHHALAVQALLQGHALGNVTLTASDALAIDGLTHAQILGSPSLTQHNVLAVQNMTHAQILQAVTLGGLVIGSLRGTLVAYSLLDGEVVCRALLSGSLETVH